MVFGIPFQAGYVTANIDRAIEMMRIQYGVAEFQSAGPVTIKGDGGDVWSIKMGHAWLARPGLN